MSIESIIAELPPELRARLERDAIRASHMTSGGHLQDWLDYEVSLWGIRNEAMRAAFVNEPKGRGYNEAHGQLMQHYGLDKLDGGCVSAVLWLTDPQPKIRDGERHLTRKEILDAIVKGLTPGQRSRLASPISARQRVQKKIEELKAGAGDESSNEKPLSKLKQAERSLAEALQREHHLQERLKHDGSLFDLKLSSAKEIAQVLVANINESKFRAIVEAAKAEYKRQKSVPAG